MAAKKTEPPKHLKFQNRQNPKATFDLIKLEELFLRSDLDHSPDQLHLVEFYNLAHGQKRSASQIF